MAKLHSTLPAPEDIWIASASFLTPGPRLTFPTTRLLAATPLFTSPSCAITPTWPWCFCTPGLISTWLVLKPFQALLNWDAAIAQWIRLCLPPCRPRFESQARHLRFCHLQSILRFICHVKRTKINKKRPGLAHLKNIRKQARDKLCRQHRQTKCVWCKCITRSRSCIQNLPHKITLIWLGALWLALHFSTNQDAQKLA